MAPTLVGAAGAVTQGASGAAVTPAWDANAGRSQGNLLVCLVTGQGSATIPTTPAGWSAPQTKAGTSCSAALFTKVATGSDAAPTIALVTSAVLSAQLMEFSGVRSQTGSDRGASNAGTVSPVVTTAAQTDAAAGELLIYVSSAFYSGAATATLTNTLNNGASANDTNNNAVSTVDHYGFGWAVTRGTTVADSDSFAFTTTNITGAVVLIASFKLAVTSAPPVFLPRSSGPKAVGPTFFAALQPPPAQPAVSGVWLPALAFPAQRNRVFASVRGRRTTVVGMQEAPVLAQRPAPIPRALHALMARGRRMLPAPAQVNPPYPWALRQGTGRRHIPPARSHRWSAAPEQSNVWPLRSPAGRRLTPPARGKRAFAIPAQQNPPYPWTIRSPAGRRLARPAKGKQLAPTPAQAVVLLSWPPSKLGAPVRMAMLRKGARTLVIAPQANPPYVRPGTVHPAAKLTALRRGSRTWPTPPQQNPPYVRRYLRPAARRYFTVQRGHGVSAAWFVLPGAAPAPPCITPPTLASILPYSSSTLVRAYSSTAAVRAYTSTGLPRAYSASPGIVAYSTTPGLVTYTSAVTFGPKYCH